MARVFVGVCLLLAGTFITAVTSAQNSRPTSLTLPGAVVFKVGPTGVELTKAGTVLGRVQVDGGVITAGTGENALRLECKKGDTSCAAIRPGTPLFRATCTKVPGGSECIFATNAEKDNLFKASCEKDERTCKDAEKFAVKTASDLCKLDSSKKSCYAASPQPLTSKACEEKGLAGVTLEVALQVPTLLAKGKELFTNKSLESVPGEAPVKQTEHGKLGAFKVIYACKTVYIEKKDALPQDEMLIGVALNSVNAAPVTTKACPIQAIKNGPISIIYKGDFEEAGRIAKDLKNWEIACTPGSIRSGNGEGGMEKLCHATGGDYLSESADGLAQGSCKCMEGEFDRVTGCKIINTKDAEKINEAKDSCTTFLNRWDERASKCVCVGADGKDAVGKEFLVGKGCYDPKKDEDRKEIEKAKELIREKCKPGEQPNTSTGQCEKSSAGTPEGKRECELNQEAKSKQCAAQNPGHIYSVGECKCIEQSQGPAGPRFAPQPQQLDCTQDYRNAYAQAQQGQQKQNSGGFLSGLAGIFGGNGNLGGGQRVQPGCETAAQAGKRDAQQNRPQQQQQAQQQRPQAASVPPLTCSGVQADKTTITEGQQVTIRFAIPGAQTYTLQGGVGTVTAAGAVVRPTTTTTYTIVGVNPQMVQQAQYAHQQYGGTTIGSTGFAVDGQSLGSVPTYGAPQQGTPGQGTCGPITITVQSKKDATKDTIPEVTKDTSVVFKNLKPELTCPSSIVLGKAATILWSCPEDPENRDVTVVSIAATVRTDRTTPQDRERLNTKGSTLDSARDGLPEGSYKTYPEGDIEYGVVCKNARNVRTKVAKCAIAVDGRRSAATPRTVRPAPAPKTSNAVPAQSSVYITATPRTIRVSQGEQVTVRWGAPSSYTCSVHGPSGYTSTRSAGSVTGGSDQAGELLFSIVCNEGTDAEVQKEVTVIAVD